MKPVRLLIVNIVFLTVGLSYSQPSRQKVTQPVQWYGSSSAIKFSSKFGLYLDGQYRFAKSMDNMQHQFRIAPEIYVNKKLTISPIGYVYIWNYLYGDQPAVFGNNEHRIYQEVKYKHSIGKFHFTHRFRAEERFIQVHKGTQPLIVDEGFENKQFRIRHRVWINYALNNDKLDAGTWYIPALIEGFMSWGNSEYITYQGKPDQLRLYTGVGYQFNKSANIQVGPFYQMLIKSKGDKQENNVGTYVQLNWNFDFSKPAAVK